MIYLGIKFEVSQRFYFSAAFARSVSLAKHAEVNGFKRYWFAEHHNMESVASAAFSRVNQLTWIPLK